MNDFRELLEERPHIVARTGKVWRYFELIFIDDFRLSIQASEHHYCEPKETLADVYDYNSFEVALLIRDKFVLPSKDKRFSAYANTAKETPYTSIFPYMPVADVQKLYETVCALADTEGQGSLLASATITD